MRGLTAPPKTKVDTLVSIQGYRFDTYTNSTRQEHSLISMSRQWCLNRVAELISGGAKHLCVVDPSPRPSDWAGYAELALEAGLRFVVIDQKPPGLRRFTPYGSPSAHR